MESTIHFYLFILFDALSTTQTGHTAPYLLDVPQFLYKWEEFMTVLGTKYVMTIGCLIVFKGEKMIREDFVSLIISENQNGQVKR